jgi:hypothetical protein
MTVAEIKAKLPEADVYEIKEDARYIVLINRETVSLLVVRAMGSHMPPQTIFVHVIDPANAVRILECPSE